MKKVILTVAVLVGMCSAQSFAAKPDTQVDALIKKLVEKGILTEQEGGAIKDEVIADEKVIREDNNKKDMPQWVQDLKLKGDFRVRSQYSHRSDSADQDRNQGRLRWRLGLETKINDKVNLGVGLASNGGDGKNSAGTSTTSGTNFSPRSNNESFQNAFAKEGIVLNYAYAQYMPNDKLTLTAGKMLNPLWEPWEFLWDNDITPEGGAMQISYPLNENLKLVSNIAAFQIEEITTNEADPFMYVLQGGVQGKVGHKVDYKVMGSYYGADNITKTLLSNRAGTNSTNPAVATQYAYHYNTYGGAMDIGMNDPFGEKFPLYIPRVGAFGEYMYNPDPKHLNKAYMMGGYLGNSKVSGFKTWKMTFAYKNIGKDAFLDTFPDSDFYSGSTDSKGYEGLFEFGLAKNVSVAIDYYRSERIKATKAQESVLQTDLNFKF